MVQANAGNIVVAETGNKRKVLSADDVKQSLLDLDDETAAACVQAFFDALQQGPITMETGLSPVDWLRARIAEANAPETPAPAPASAPSLCSVA